MDIFFMLCSPTIIEPLEGSYNRNNNLARVVFPDPVSPTIPIDVPFFIFMLKSSNRIGDPG